MCAIGGAEAQRGEGGAVQSRAGGGGQGGSSKPGERAEVGDAEDGQGRVPGEGKLQESDGPPIFISQVSKGSLMLT